AIVFAGALVAAPAALLGIAAIATTALVPEADRRALAPTFRAFAYALVPLGVGLWLAHYGFHLLTGVLTIVPVSQSAALDLLGWAALGEPRWTWAGMRPGSVFPIQLGAVLLGVLGSLSVAYLIAEREHPRAAMRAALPWA